MKRLATWNVNGIRACLGKGFLDWMKEEKFDIVCLNETKANVEQLPEELKAAILRDHELTLDNYLNREDLVNADPNVKDDEE